MMINIQGHRIARGLSAALLAVTLAACSTTSTGGSDTMGQYLDDSTTTTRIKSAMVRDREVSAGDIQVETYHGTVQLSGYADSPQEIKRAVELARATPGVASVHNNIRLKPR